MTVPPNDPEAYGEKLAGFRDALSQPSVGALAGAEIAELERLIRKYPREARQFVERLPPPEEPPASFDDSQ